MSEGKRNSSYDHKVFNRNLYWVLLAILRTKSKSVCMYDMYVCEVSMFRENIFFYCKIKKSSSIAFPKEEVCSGKEMSCS